MPELSIHFDSRNWLSESSNSTKIQLIGTLIVAVFYGLVVSLVCHTLQPLIFHSKERTYSNRMRWFLIVYTVFMFLLSTGAFAQTVAFVMHIVFDSAPLRPQSIVGSNIPLLLPLTMWGADSMMIWRCIILHTNATRRRRIIVHCGLCGLSLISLGSGILYYVLPTVPLFSSNSLLIPTMITISVTTLVNFLLTSLITFRLLHHQKSIRTVLGAEYGSPYMRLVVILVESCALIVLTGIIYLVLFTADRKSGTIIPMLLLPHICVISPLTIVYAVGKGKSIHKAPPPAGDDLDNMGDRLGIACRERGTSVISQPIAFMDPELASDPLQAHDSDGSGSETQGRRYSRERNSVDSSTEQIIL